MARAYAFARKRRRLLAAVCGLLALCIAAAVCRAVVSGTPWWVGGLWLVLPLLMIRLCYFRLQPVASVDNGLITIPHAVLPSVRWTIEEVEVRGDPFDTETRLVVHRPTGRKRRLPAHLAAPEEDARLQEILSMLRRTGEGRP